jgi:hypothetical protein
MSRAMVNLGHSWVPRRLRHRPYLGRNHVVGAEHFVSGARHRDHGYVRKGTIRRRRRNRGLARYGPDLLRPIEGDRDRG